MHATNNSNGQILFFSLRRVTTPALVKHNSWNAVVRNTRILQTKLPAMHLIGQQVRFQMFNN